MNAACRRTRLFTSQASSLLLTSALLMGAAYAPRHGSGIALLTAGAYAACALSTAGYSAAYFEVCPRCAGQAFAVSNTFATLPGIAAPLIAQVRVRASLALTLTLTPTLTLTLTRAAHRPGPRQLAGGGGRMAGRLRALRVWDGAACAASPLLLLPSGAHRAVGRAA